MLSLLDKLVEAIQTTSNPVDKIELYLEYIESKNKKSLYNEFFWGKNHSYDQIKNLVMKATKNLDLITNVLQNDPNFKNDPVIKQLYLKIDNISKRLENNLGYLEGEKI